MPNDRSAIQRLLWRSKGHTHKAFEEEKMVQRIRKRHISTESISLSNTNAKMGQAWKYPGNQVIRAPSMALYPPRSDGKPYEDPKDPGQPRRKQQSNFFITLNTNLAYSEGHGDLWMKALENTLQRLSSEREMAKYFKFGPLDEKYGTTYANDRFGAVIQSVDWKGAVEVGPLLNRIHSHIWLTVDHYSQVQINVQALMHMSKQMFNEESVKLAAGRAMTKQPYVHVKLLPQSNWTEVMRQYIHKAMSTEKVKEYKG